jgi:alpha-methylacyl-CoA racemase
MVLSDLGADVVRVDRAESAKAGASKELLTDPLARGRRSVAVDLKSDEGRALLLDLVEKADVLIEGFRPGVMERLGVGPEVCLARNPRLVFGRMTGFGQDGPLASAAGHDINYISISGNLWPIGRAGERPVAPINYVGDFGGGGMLLALGVIAALFERTSSGAGQVVDAAMVDGAGLLNAFLYGMRAAGNWKDERAANLLDTGAPFYDTYTTSDGQWMSVGAIEPQFYANLVATLGLDLDLSRQHDPRAWPAAREAFATAFAGRTRDEWAGAFDGVDACVAPVLSPWEAPHHPHAAAREAFTEVFGVTQPSPAPRFSRTPGAIAGPPAIPGAHTDEVLAEWGVRV